MHRSIRNVNIVACKIGPVLIKVTNLRLEVAKEKKQKIEKRVKMWKIEAMIAKY